MMSAASPAPAKRTGHVGVWTGTQLIVWGGQDGTNSSGFNRLNTGGVYTLSSNSWTTTTTTNAPSARRNAVAVWTGSKMIVWGGDANTGTSATTNVLTDSGGVYDPSTNSWTATSTLNAPTARQKHKAVWDVSSQKMIVWGGCNGTCGAYYNTGGMYDPATNTWTAISTTSAPAARSTFIFTQTSSGPIVYGGEDTLNSYLDTGAWLNTSTNTWTTIRTSSAVRYHMAAWNGTEVVVFGGYNSTGGSIKVTKNYNVSTNAWTTKASTTVARQNGCAAWSGTFLYVFGGIDITTLANLEFYIPF